VDIHFISEAITILNDTHQLTPNKPNDLYNQAR
jgi:hypothetical protein